MKFDHCRPALCGGRLEREIIRMPGAEARLRGTKSSSSFQLEGVQARMLAQRLTCSLTYLSTPRNRRCGDEEALQMAGSWDDSRAADEIVSRLRQERTTRRAQEGF